jgi:hypothetical protein
VSTTLTTLHNVSESAVTVTATSQTRRLMVARKLTTSWQVDYLIVADKDTADRIYEIAEELSDSSNTGTYHAQFSSLLSSALSSSTGVSVTASVTHSVPSTPTIVTASATGATMATMPPQDSQEAQSSALLMIGIIGGSIVALLLAAVCLGYLRYRTKSKYNQERARDEHDDTVISEEDHLEAGTPEAASRDAEDPTGPANHLEAAGSPEAPSRDNSNEPRRLGSQIGNPRAIPRGRRHLWAPSPGTTDTSREPSPLGPQVGDPREPLASPRSDTSGSGAAPREPRDLGAPGPGTAGASREPRRPSGPLNIGRPLSTAPRDTRQQSLGSASLSPRGAPPSVSSTSAPRSPRAASPGAPPTNTHRTPRDLRTLSQSRSPTSSAGPSA